MKNKFLLLAATALLSMGAIAANATDSIPGDTASVGVNAELVKVRAIQATSPLSFGRVAFMEYTGQYPMNTISIDINEDGGTVIAETGTMQGKGDAEAYVLSQGTRGVVKGATCDELDYPGKDNQGFAFLSINNVPAGADSSDAILSRILCKTIDNTSAFYGQITIENDEGIVPGTYSGSFTVTLIANP